MKDDLFDQSVTEAVESAILSFKDNDLQEWELHLIMRRAEMLETKLKELNHES